MQQQTREGRGAAHAAWARAVKDRDGYACQSCGRVGQPRNPRGPRVEAHHIRPWATFPHLRYDVGNGETLCVSGEGSCHRRMHRIEHVRGGGLRLRRRLRRGVSLWKLVGGFLAFYTLWFWFAPRDIALRPTRAALAYIVLLLVLRVMRRLRR